MADQSCPFRACVHCRWDTVCPTNRAAQPLPHQQLQLTGKPERDILRPLGPLRELCALKDLKLLEAEFQCSHVTAGTTDIRFSGKLKLCGIMWNYISTMWNYVNTVELNTSLRRNVFSVGDNRLADILYVGTTAAKRCEDGLFMIDLSLFRVVMYTGHTSTLLR